MSEIQLFFNYFNLDFEYDEDYKLFHNVENNTKLKIVLSEKTEKCLFFKKINLTDNMIKNICYQLSFVQKNNWNEIYNQIKNFTDYYFLFDVFFDKNYIFQTNNHEETLIISRAILNKNSLSFMKNQNFERFIKIEFPVFVKDFQKNLKENFEPIDQNRFIVFSSTVFWANGLRKNNDIDCYISKNPIISKTFDFHKKVLKMTENEKFDIFWINYCNWTIFTEFSLQTFCNIMKIPDFDELIFNPKYHFYFLGIKMTLLEFEILRKQFRQRASSIADLIAYKNILNPKFNYFSIEINKAKKLIESKNNDNYDNPNIVKTIKNKLFYDYQLNFSFNEIKKIIQIINNEV